MDIDLSKLSDDTVLTKKDIVFLIEALETKHKEKIHYLEERIRLLQNELFGQKSEKHYPGPGDLQLPIFSAGLNVDQQHVEPESEHSIEVAAHQRKKRGRKPLPANLPRIEIIHDLGEDEKVCPCGAR
jgi:transposase